MKYKEYKLCDINDFNKFRSIERATNPGRDVKGYIYAIDDKSKIKLGTLSVKTAPYDYFHRNNYLGPDERRCYIVLSEPHLQYKENLERLLNYDAYQQCIEEVKDELEAFQILLGRLNIDGSLEPPSKNETPKKKIEKIDSTYRSMDKGELYLFLHKKIEEIEKINSVINEQKSKREEIHTTIKNAEYRLKQLL